MFLFVANLKYEFELLKKENFNYALSKKYKRTINSVLLIFIRF